MTVTKAKAAASFDYKGMTYYFCSTGCRDRFAKDPEKYVQAAGAKAPAQAGQMSPMGGQMGQMGQGQMGMMKRTQGAGQSGACPMMQGRMGGQMGRMGMMQGGMGRPMGAPGMGLLFRLYEDKIDVTVENTKDGATLKFASKDPEVAKAIQVHLAEHLALMKKMKEAAAKPATGGAPSKESGMACCDGCQTKK
jgi:Cu+-exporting ATPase